MIVHVYVIGSRGSAKGTSDYDMARDKDELNIHDPSTDFCVRNRPAAMTKEESLEMQEKDRHDRDEQEDGRVQREEDEELTEEEEEDEEEEKEKGEEEDEERAQDEDERAGELEDEGQREPPVDESQGDGAADESEPPSVSALQSPVHETRRRAMVHPSAQAPLPKDYGAPHQGLWKCMPVVVPP